MSKILQSLKPPWTKSETELKQELCKVQASTDSELNLDETRSKKRHIQSSLFGP